jgi:hypothetical protein
MDRSGGYQAPDRVRAETGLAGRGQAAFVAIPECPAQREGWVANIHECGEFLPACVALPSLDRIVETSPSPSKVGWAQILSTLPELTTVHGVRFFYDVDPAAPARVSDRSRVKKNDETASLLAWKCPKLRQLEHGEVGSGKVVVLLKEDGKRARYEVRRIKT